MPRAPGRRYWVRTGRTTRTPPDAMPRVHPRMEIVNVASRHIRDLLWDAIMREDITYVEALVIIHDFEDEVLAFLLRMERHPRNPRKRANEA